MNKKLSKIVVLFLCSALFCFFASCSQENEGPVVPKVSENPENPVDPEDPEEPEILNFIYVSSNGLNTNTGTSADSPVDSIASALSKITAEEDGQDWKIYISGEIKGTNTISLSAGSAASLILSGKTGNTTDILNGNNSGTTLTINTTVPVTIKNLKITGGKGINGGGLNINANSNVVLSDGVVISGNIADAGGGVYNEGKLFMCRSAVIGDAGANAAATDTVWSNKSSNGSGGGIYMNNDSSRLYLGYSDENTEVPLTGGIYHNYATGQWSSGSGIACDKGKVFMASGNISYNAITSNRPGSGVFIYNSSTFTMSGGEISHNSSGYTLQNGAKKQGGGGIRLAGTFTMNGGKIINNTADEVGGGMSISGNGSFTMTGGTIKDNTSKSNQNINIEDGSPKVKINGSDVNDFSVINASGIEL